MTTRFSLLAIVLFLTGFTACVNGQQVIASSGNHFSQSNGSVSWTLGEPLIQTLSKEPNQLTQGFHQSKLVVSSVFHPEKSPFQVLAWPNPGSDQVQIQLQPLPEKGSFRALLFDQQGKLLQTILLQQGTASIPLTPFPPGTYFLVIFDHINLVQRVAISKF